MTACWLLCQIKVDFLSIGLCVSLTAPKLTYSTTSSSRFCCDIVAACCITFENELCTLLMCCTGLGFTAGGGPFCLCGGVATDSVIPDVDTSCV